MRLSWRSERLKAAPEAVNSFYGRVSTLGAGQPSANLFRHKPSRVEERISVAITILLVPCGNFVLF